MAILTLPVLVLDDGASHLVSASALGYLLAGDFGDFLEWRPGLPPNLAVEFVLLGLLQVLPPMGALKLLVAAIVLGFALAARRLMTAVGAPGYWAILLLPFAWHRLLALGFLGFALAVVLALLAIARTLRRPTGASPAPLAALLALTWLTHLVPAVLATAVCATIIVIGPTGPDAPLSDVPRGRRVLRAALAAAPTLVLTVVFTAVNPSEEYTPQPGSVVRRVVSVLAMIKANVSSSPVEYAVYALAALVLYLAAGTVLLGRLRHDRRVRTVDVLLLAALFGDVVAVVAPEGVRGAGGFLGVRFAVFPPILLAVWVAAHLTVVRPGRARAAATGVLAVMGVLALLLVAIRLPAQHTYSRLASEILELAPCLPEGSTVAQLNVDDVGALAVQSDPLSNQVALLATQRESLDLRNESGWVPYYLWRYRDGQNLDEVLSTALYGTISNPLRVDLDGAVRRGLRLDAVFLIGRPDAGPVLVEDAPTRKLLTDLETYYRRAATSSHGEAELWLRAGVSSTCG